MDITVNNLKRLIQSTNINFLYGSGLSRDYLPTLGNIEKLLSEAVELGNNEEKKIIQLSLYAKYFKTVMKPCLKEEISKKQIEYDNTYNEYVRLLESLNHIITFRNVNLINKQINLFTTNIDDFMEKAAEKAMIEFNDGFKGRIDPIFNEDSFSNVVSKSSPIYQNTSEIPTFNLYKMHGSINWESEKDSTIIRCDSNLTLIGQISKALNQIESYKLITVNEKTTITDLELEAHKINSVYNGIEYGNFSELYSKLAIINPSKAKFRETVLDYHFYELMRMYSNALERRSSTLFVAGFSFADEHIAQITMRAANANPTLQIVVFAYDTEAKESIECTLKTESPLINNNIVVISPKEYKDAAKKENPNTYDFDELKYFDLKSINDFVFKKIAKTIRI